MIRISFFIMLAVWLPAAAYAQSKQNIEYEKEAAALRKQVWEWDLPQFQQRSVPAEFANASRVVLARHTDLSADSRSKLKFTGLGFGVSREQNLTEITREMIRLNDKKAVSDYSEFSFTQIKKSGDYLVFDRSSSYVGIRVIKPDGTVKEIEANDIIRTKDERSEKRAKVAIPDLQSGDIVDYFIATQQQFNNDLQTRFYTLPLFDDAPVLHLSFFAQLGKKYAVKYRSYNGAPELITEKADDDEIQIKMEKTNVPTFETAMWVFPTLQLPFIRLDISLGYKGAGSKSLGAARPGEIEKNPDPEGFMESRAKDLGASYHMTYSSHGGKPYYNEIVRQAKKFTKQSGEKFDDLPLDEKAAQLFYALRYQLLMRFDINDLGRTVRMGELRFNGLAPRLFFTFKFAGLEPQYSLGTPRDGFRMKEVMSEGDLWTLTHLPGPDKFYYISSIFDHPFSVPAEFEGTQRRSITIKDKMLLGAKGNATVETSGPRIKASSSSDNAHIEDLKLELSAPQSNLLVKRLTTLRGHFRRAGQTSLTLYEDLYEHERKAFNEELTLLEELEKDKRGKKYVSEAKKAFDEARKKQKTAFEDEAKEWFEQDIKDLKDHKIVNPGIRHTAPDFVFGSTFNLEGLVKKAGENYLIEIGKIQGNPLLLKDEQRKRDIDVYMPFARSFEYHIELKVPDGFSAEGVEALNKAVKNDAGYFTAEAKQTENLVTITIKKHYLKTFIPVSEWQQVLDFTDAANEWTNAKILFKKV